MRNKGIYALTIEDKLKKFTIEGDNGCIIWSGSRNAKGYGTTRYKGQSWLAHRLMYTVFVGNIPEGLTVDHLCRNTSCVNHLHLEVVTSTENYARSLPFRKPLTHCRRGHERSPDNLYKSGHCKTCTKAGAKKHITQRKEGTT